jgi:hypothetical protein
MTCNTLEENQTVTELIIIEIRNTAKISSILSVIFAVWLLIALVVGQTQLLKSLPIFAVPILVFSLTGFILLAVWKIPSLRRWAFAIDIRALLLLHVTRFVGIYFLILYARGVLPYEMVKAGWGDIFAAATAMLVCLFAMSGRTSWSAVFIWNCYGLLDILLVVTTPLRLVLQGSNSAPSLNQVANAFTQLPLSLLPTFLVPLIIASHIIIFTRLSMSRRKNFNTL